MTVLEGPWGNTPVRQAEVIEADISTSDHYWWIRDKVGQLHVRCGDKWHIAPIPEWTPPKNAPLRAGYVIPDRPPTRERITRILDARGMFGPEVDEALGYDDDTTVDQWEAGTLTPTASDIRRLATLTNVLPGFFYQPAIEPIEVFICGRTTP